MEEKNFKPLPIKDSAQAAADADAVLREGMSGQQLALFSRHSKVNKALLGGFRFDNTYIIGGTSGSGKSYYLNQLLRDFRSDLNINFSKKFKVLQFAFEMNAYGEALRAASGETSVSYRQALSADEPLTQANYNLIRAYLDKFRDFEIYYVEASGNVDQIYATIYEFKRKFPDHELIIGMDHTLLSDYRDERDEIQLVTNVSRMFLKVRKELHTMNLIIAQLNADIEDKERIINPALHYPKRKDLHGSKAVYRDADFVSVLHNPESLGIKFYGTESIPTQGLIAWHLIKARHGDVGLVRMKNKLSEGKIEQIE